LDRDRTHQAAIDDTERTHRVGGRGEQSTNAMRPVADRNGVNDPADPGLNPPGRIGGVTNPGGAPTFIK